MEGIWPLPCKAVDGLNSSAMSADGSGMVEGAQSEPVHPAVLDLTHLGDSCPSRCCNVGLKAGRQHSSFSCHY